MSARATPGPSVQALKTARIIMNDDVYIFTQYGKKTMEGLADLIDRETQHEAQREVSQNWFEACQEARHQRDTFMSVARHILAMKDDAYLVGHPEWHAIVEEAQAAIAAAEKGAP